MKTLQHPQIIPTSAPIFPITEENIKKYLYKMPRLNIEMVFFGSDSWSIHVLKALEDNFDVKAVVAAPDSAVANYFKGLVLALDELDKNFKSDLFVVASYGKIIPKSILDIPKYGALNVHPSLLPKYRGPSPVPATILAGEKQTGVTIIKMDEKMDHGPIVYTKKIRLSGQENITDLINKLFQLGAEVLVDIIPDFIKGRIKLKPQNHSKATYCHLLTKEDGYFEIDNPPSPEQLDRMIRAFYPWPNAWTKWNGKIVKFYPDGKIQMEGKKIMPLKDFLNGYPDFPIKSF